MSWDFATSAWVARGRQLKAVEFSAEEAERLGVDKAAWLLFTYPKKKAFARARVCNTGWGSDAG